jgi:hypothetical protein
VHVGGTAQHVITMAIHGLGHFFGFGGLPYLRSGGGKDRQTRRMWTFLSTLAGGLIALLASVSTTYYIQRQVLKAERRARATRAADDILAAISELRDLPREPKAGSPGPDEWSDKKVSLVNRIQTQPFSSQCRTCGSA